MGGPTCDTCPTCGQLIPPGRLCGPCAGPVFVLLRNGKPYLVLNGFADIAAARTYAATVQASATTLGRPAKFTVK